MIAIVKGRQRIGKTTIAVGIAVVLVRDFGYSVTDIVSNLHLYKPDGRELSGYHYLNIKGMRAYVRSMVDKGLKHRIIIVDEIDRVFSHRFWQKTEQSESLLGLWQDEKLYNWIIGTAHIGKSVDVLIRECMQLEIIPYYRDTVNDCMRYHTINTLDRRISRGTMHNMKLIQSLFDTREPVV